MDDELVFGLKVIRYHTLEKSLEAILGLLCFRCSGEERTRENGTAVDP